MDKPNRKKKDNKQEGKYCDGEGKIFILYVKNIWGILIYGFWTAPFNFVDFLGFSSKGVGSGVKNLGK